MVAVAQKHLLKPVRKNTTTNGATESTADRVDGITDNYYFKLNVIAEAQAFKAA